MTVTTEVWLCIRRLSDFDLDGRESSTLRESQQNVPGCDVGTLGYFRLRECVRESVPYSTPVHLSGLAIRSIVIVESLHRLLHYQQTVFSIFHLRSILRSVLGLDWLS